MQWKLIATSMEPQGDLVTLGGLQPYSSYRKGSDRSIGLKDEKGITPSTWCCLLVDQFHTVWIGRTTARQRQMDSECWQSGRYPAVPILDRIPGRVVGGHTSSIADSSSSFKTRLTFSWLL